MRVKTDERRRVIMDAAAAVFREIGYERASMAAISARVGGSKGTLYSYFESKEKLFAAVMLDAVDAQAQQMVGLLDFADGRDLRETLEAFGRAYVDFILSADVLALTRTGIAEGGGGSLGAALHDRGPKEGWQIVTARLTRWIEEGYIDAPDSHVAALHLKGLLETGLLEPCLYGADVLIQREEAVRLAVDMFFRAYSTQRKGGRSGRANGSDEDQK